MHHNQPRIAGSKDGSLHRCRTCKSVKTIGDTNICCCRTRSEDVKHVYPRYAGFIHISACVEQSNHTRFRIRERFVWPGCKFKPLPLAISERTFDLFKLCKNCQCPVWRQEHVVNTAIEIVLVSLAYCCGAPHLHIRVALGIHITLWRLQNLVR
jgi:hypothetical protein